MGVDAQPVILELFQDKGRPAMPLSLPTVYFGVVDEVAENQPVLRAEHYFLQNMQFEVM